MDSGNGNEPRSGVLRIDVAQRNRVGVSLAHPVLGIHRKDGSHLGAPEPSTHIEPKDRLILYSSSQQLAEGDREHDKACARQAQAAGITV